MLTVIPLSFTGTNRCTTLTYCRLDGLLTGVSIAALFVFKPGIRQRLQQYGNLLFLVSLLVLTGAYFLCQEESSFNASIFGFPLVSVGYGLIVMAAASPDCFLYRYNNPVIARIAVLSYALYLTHKIIIHITQEQLVQMSIDKDSNLMFLLCILTSILLSLIHI